MDILAQISRQQIIERRFGRVVVNTLASPPLLYLQAQGYIGPVILQEVIKVAHNFGECHPNGWDYIVDPVEVKLASPLNLIWFRKIHRLPHLRRYITLAPSSALLTILAPLVSWLTGPDMILHSPEELNRLYEVDGY